MPVVVVRPVGMFRAKFHGIEPCKNTKYCNVLLEPEYDRPDKFSPEKHLHEVEEVSKFKHLVPGKEYFFRCAIGINSANERDGKTYPARINLKIFEAKEVMA
jgi:hypothetical protein